MQTIVELCFYLYYTITVCGNILDCNPVFLHFICLMGDIILMVQLFKRSYHARRWIKLGVLPSYLPIILVILFDLRSGYTIINIINRHILDFLLIIFAIAVSVFSSAMILYKKSKSMKNTEKAENHILYSVLIGLSCSIYFAIQYDEITQEDALSLERIFICIIQIIITFLLIYKGMQTEEKLGTM